MAMRRGFMASGISRTNWILSKPLEGRALDLYVVRQVELPLELAGGDALVQELAFGLFILPAFDGKDILLGRDRDLIRREARHRQRDLVAVVGMSFDVVGRIAFFGGPLGPFDKVEQAVETDGRPEEEREGIAKSSKEQDGYETPDTTGARPSRGPNRAPQEPRSGGAE